MDLRTAIYRYCNYQERCHQDVRNKLYELGAKTTEVEELIAELISADLLNEERFARNFARGKFRMKKWGRKKILQELKRHKISEYCIRKAMLEIDSEEYDQTSKRLVEKKWKELGGEKEYIKRAKLFRYMLQKGYENDIISDQINFLLMNGCEP
jgi:regulatory protein